MSALFDNPFPVLTLTKSVMRALRSDDIPDFYAYMRDEEVGRFVSDEDLPKDLQAAKYELAYWMGLFDRKQSVFWGVEEPGSGQLIGTAGFNYWNRDHAKAEISYDLNRSFWGKGIMTEVVKSLVAYGFDAMDLHRITATVSVDNAGSIRVLEKAGFVCEARMEDFKIVHGQYHDFYLYSIINRM